MENSPNQNINQKDMIQAANPAQPSNSPLKQNQGVTKGYYFQTQTKRLKAYYLTHQQELIGRKVLFNNSAGIVRYFGPLVHEGKPANSQDQPWIGIEWQQINRGKHNGTVNGHSYFNCPKNQGSLLKYEKIEFGYRLEIALFKRYFKLEELHHAKDIYDNLKEIKEEIKMEENKQAKIQQAITKKIHKIEYDAQAYLDTVKQSKKILIQFVGFDQIWHKINNLDKLQSISLAECKICDLGYLGHLNSLLKNLKQLSLEDNLISDWNQVYQLGHQLPQLNELSLSYNKLAQPEKDFQDLSVVHVTGRNQSFELQSVNMFKNLRSLIIIKTGLTWKSFFKVVAAFKHVHEFILCKNDLSDTASIDEAKLDFLEEARFLNLEETNQTDFDHLHSFSKLPKLERLILNRNPLKQIGTKISGFTSLKHLSVQFCSFQKPVVLAQASQFANLESLSVKNNPMGDKLGNSYIRMRAVAELPKLTHINGAPLKKVERKDFQIFYLRQTFREYFSFKKVPDYDYDFDDFLKYCEQHHFNLPRLIKKYGNPYEVQKKQQIQELIKEEVKQTQNKKGTGMIQITIEYKQNEVKQSKKIPLSWTVNTLRNFFVKTTKIPASMLRMHCYAQQNSGPQEMTQNHKQLSFYSLISGSRIVVQRIVPE